MGYRVLRVSNISREAHRSDLKNLFRDCGYIVDLYKTGREATVVSQLLIIYPDFGFGIWMDILPKHQLGHLALLRSLLRPGTWNCFLPVVEVMEPEQGHLKDSRIS